ncbi:MAG: hypothetical protein ACRDPC_10455 [Solirubrobacteraceae bacterium]
MTAVDILEAPPGVRERYIIRGGRRGRERLRALAYAPEPTTGALLDRVDSAPGMRCLDAGSGGGDVTRELRIVQAWRRRGA